LFEIRTLLIYPSVLT